MKDPAPTRRTRTWAGRSQLKRSASLPTNRMIQLAHAVSRATAIEKTHSQTVEPVMPLPSEMPPSTVTPPRPLHSPRVRPKVSSTEVVPTSDLAKQIEAQAARVEQLSTELRAAMAQLKTMTQAGSVEAVSQPNQECGSAVVQAASSTATHAATGKLIQNPAGAEEAIAVATPNQALAEAPETSLNQAKQNATSTAQMLRRLRHRQRPSDRLRLRRVEPTRTKAQPTSKQRLSLLKRYRWLRQTQRWVSAAVQLPVGTPALVSDAAVWVAIAAAVRVGLQTLIQTYPVLWFPVVLLVAGAAMLTTYQAVFNSAVGSIWGYRLLLIVIGLLLGGRL